MGPSWGPESRNLLGKNVCGEKKDICGTKKFFVGKKSLFAGQKEFSGFVNFS